MKNNCKIDFQPIAKRVDVLQNTTLLEAAQQAGIITDSSCGGAGKCGLCRLTIMEGEVSTFSDSERNILSPEAVESGERLACQTHALTDLKVFIPETSLITEQRLQLGGDSITIEPDPLIKAFEIKSSQPELTDPQADLERITDALTEVNGKTDFSATPEVISQLSSLARDNKWHMTAFLRENEIIGFSPVGKSGPASPLGMAVDLGTTKIAGSLVDLNTGKELSVAGILNPQIGYGEDVISRLTYACKNDNGARTLAMKVREAFNDLLERLVLQEGVSRDLVTDICVVGNTAMTHLLAGLPVRQLASAPYVAATNSPIDIKAGELSISASPGAYVHILPGIGGFVGADNVAMILASGLHSSKKTSLGIDIGTNTEIVLANPDQTRLTTASCASGPAFEGAHISDGMRAASGAIETIKITNSGIQVKTVGDKPAVGLCGSGIVDAAAELRRHGLINESGRFDKSRNKFIRQGEKGLEFLLIPGTKSGKGKDIVVTQNDINEIQLAKGAIRAGLEILLDSTGTDPASVEEVIIAGAFGSYLDIQSIIDIGLIPKLPNATYRQVGNAALIGSVRSLVCSEDRETAIQIAQRSDYFELTGYPKFNRQFALGMMFPKFLE